MPTRQRGMILPLWRLVIIPVALLFAGEVLLNFYLHRLESDSARKDYRNEVQTAVSLIERRFNNTLVVAEAIKGFFVSSVDVTADEFEEYAQIITNEVDSLGLPLTMEWIDAGNIIRYVHPATEENLKVVGIDINKTPNRLEPILKTKETRLPVVTEPVLLVQGYPGLLLYSSIYKGGVYLGAAVVLIRLSDLLYLPIQPIYEYRESLETDDYIVPFNQEFIFTKTGGRIVSPQGDTVSDPAAAAYLSPAAEVVADIKFADKSWQLRFVPRYNADVFRRVAIYAGLSIFLVLVVFFNRFRVYRFQKEILKEKAQTDALLSSVADGIIAVDEKGKLIFSNGAAEKISGFKEEESIGKEYCRIWRLADEKGNPVPREQGPFYRALASGKTLRISVTDHLYIFRKDGTRFPLDSTLSPIMVGGEVNGMIVVFRDATKEAEIDRMKTEFLSLATHQLLTPANVVQWVSESLLEGDAGRLNKKAKEDVVEIYSSIHRMIDLVNALLNVSRIESGRFRVEPVPTDLTDLAKGAVKELDQKIKEKKQSLNVIIEPGLPEINVDPNLVSQIYSNLLSNAVKYSPAKGKISLEIRRKDGEIVSEVKDNGYGIPEKEQSRVFSKFYRGSNIVEKEKDGNGLGLYLVKQIVLASGGRIGFESHLGQGTNFWFSLPLGGSRRKAGEVNIS